LLTSRYSVFRNASLC